MTVNRPLRIHAQTRIISAQGGRQLETQVWIALVISSLLVGVMVVGALVVRRSLELLVVGLGIGALFVCAWSFTNIVRLNSEPSAGLWALLLAVAGVIGGYVLASGLLDAAFRSRERGVPGRIDEPPGQGVSIIVAACTDAETYTPERTKRDLDELMDQSVLETGLGLTPFLFAASKARFRSVGGRNPGPSQLSAVAEGLEREIAEGLGGEQLVHTGWVDCADPAALKRMVLSAATGGSRTIVIAPYAVATSVAMAAAVREIDALRLADHGFTVVVSPTLEGSEDLAAMVSQRVLDVAAGSPDVGVALVAHGLPEQLEQMGEDFDQQEIRFVNRVRMLLSEAGIPDSHVRVAWSEWRSPDIAETIGHLGALGCERILVVPAVFPVESLTTLLDLVQAARHTESTMGVSTTVLPAWRDDPIAIGALTHSVRSALAEAARDPGRASS
jgi:protoheme ferro-lyase